MNDGTRTGSRNPRRLVLPLGVAAIVVVVLGVWWTKTIAFTASASVHIETVDAIPTTVGAIYQNNLMACQRVTYATTQDLAQGVAAVRGGSAFEYVGDLTLISNSDDFQVQARGRTPGAAKALANDAAEALAGIYRTTPVSDCDPLVTVTVMRAD